MSAGGISVARTLPIDGALLSDVLLRLRRDSAASALRWTLGDLGCAEVDVSFITTGTPAGTAWTSTARLWNLAGLVVMPANVLLEAISVDEVRLTLEPVSPPGPEWGESAREFTGVAQAALDELAEELLWHATRAGINA